MPKDKSYDNAGDDPAVDPAVAPAAYEKEPASPEQAKQEPAVWSVKNNQEIVDKHSGLTLRFGTHTDDASSVFLQISYGPNGTHLMFQRDGTLLSAKPMNLAPPAPGEANKNVLTEGQKRSADAAEKAPREADANAGYKEPLTPSTPASKK